MEIIKSTYVDQTTLYEIVGPTHKEKLWTRPCRDATTIGHYINNKVHLRWFHQIENMEDSQNESQNISQEK